jgi:hypothetical protein
VVARLEPVTGVVAPLFDHLFGKDSELAIPRAFDPARSNDRSGEPAETHRKFTPKRLPNAARRRYHCRRLKNSGT